MGPKKTSNKNVLIMYGSIVGIFLFILSGHYGLYKKANPSAGLFDGIGGAFNHLRSNFFNMFPFTGDAWKFFTISVLIIAFCGFYLYIDGKRKEVTMRGREGGTAEWNGDLKEYNKQYTDPKNSPKSKLYPSENAILSNDIFLSLNTRQTMRNNNTLVIGGSGSGKSRFYVKPNLLQANASYVVTDPAGELLASTGKFLENKGYEIKIFNLMDMKRSHRYNPFRYVHADKEEEVLTMIDCLIENTTSSNKKGGDQFWESAEKTLLRALCYYLIKYEKPEDQNWSTVMFLLRQASVDEEHPEAESNLDKLFNEVAKTEPESIAVTQYKSFKQGAGKTLKSILISCSVRLSVFDIEQLACLTNEDDMDLANMGMERRAYFVITPQTTETFNFLVAMLYTQMFQVLYEEGGKLLEEGRYFNYEIRFLLDEFVNIGKIPQFDVKIATMRKYRISCAVILQAIAQLKTVYEEADATIIANCDTKLFLGGADKETAEYLSEMFGKQTIREANSSMSYGSSKSNSQSYSYKERNLINPDELLRMDNNNCIVWVRGLQPFYTTKFDYPKHPNYPLTGDAKDELLYVNNLNNMQHAKASDTNEIKKKEEKRKQTAFAIDVAMRSLVRNAVLSGNSLSTEPIPFEQYIDKYTNNKDGDIFEQLSVVKTITPVTEKESNILSNELGLAILKSIPNRARNIILDYKKKLTEDNNVEKPSLIEHIQNVEPEAVDEFTQMFYATSN